MKKLICFCLLLFLCFGFAGCKNKETENKTKVTSPLTEVNTICDKYGNILQQTVYNEQTGEYITTVFTYVRDPSGTFVCTDQKTTITGLKKECHTPVCSTLNIYYQVDLSNKPIILLDNQDIKISIIEYLDKASWWRFGYKLEIVNKSDLVLIVMFDHVTIADVTCKPMFFVEQVEANSTRYLNLAWDEASLERAWVPYLGDVGFVLKVYSTEDYRAPAKYGIRALIKN